MYEVLSSENGIIKVKLSKPKDNLKSFLVVRSSESSQYILEESNGIIDIPLVCPNGGRTTVFEEVVNPITGALSKEEEVFADSLTVPTKKLAQVFAPSVVATNSGE